jgi:hypothetical protein
MISAGLAWGIGHSGAQGVGASKPDTIQPSIFFGKGFGDLPDGLAWLRPFAVTGAVTLEHPTRGTSTNFGIDEDTGQLGPLLTRNVDTLHWGFSLQYSMFYLTNRYTPGKLPKDEPVHQFIPLVEFAFDTPRKNRCHDESWIGVCGGCVAGCRRGHRSDQQRRRTHDRHARTSFPVPRRSLPLRCSENHF